MRRGWGSAGGWCRGGDSHSRHGSATTHHCSHPRCYRSDRRGSRRHRSVRMVPSCSPGDTAPSRRRLSCRAPGERAVPSQCRPGPCTLHLRWRPLRRGERCVASYAVSVATSLPAISAHLGPGSARNGSRSQLHRFVESEELVLGPVEVAVRRPHVCSHRAVAGAASGILEAPASGVFHGRCSGVPVVSFAALPGAADRGVHRTGSSSGAVPSSQHSREVPLGRTCRPRWVVAA